MGWFSQDADHQNDNIQVLRGIKYTEKVYLNDSNNGSVSDSCDPDNGLNKGYAPLEPGSYDPDSPDFPNGNIGVHSCELWSFPNGNGGRYYMYLNCMYYSIP